LRKLATRRACRACRRRQKRRRGGVNFNASNACSNLGFGRSAEVTDNAVGPL
jgi:hypothetical protein